MKSSSRKNKTTVLVFLVGTYCYQIIPHQAEIKLITKQKKSRAVGERIKRNRENKKKILSIWMKKQWKSSDKSLWFCVFGERVEREFPGIEKKPSPKTQVVECWRQTRRSGSLCHAGQSVEQQRVGTQITQRKWRWFWGRERNSRGESVRPLAKAKGRGEWTELYLMGFVLHTVNLRRLSVIWHAETVRRNQKANSHTNYTENVKQPIRFLCH